MSGFTSRAIHRALGTGGGIQPRFVPITAPIGTPDPWSTVASPPGLEVPEEVEAQPELVEEHLRRGLEIRERRADEGHEPEEHRAPAQPHHLAPAQSHHGVPEPPHHRMPEPPHHRMPEPPHHRMPEPPLFRVPEQPRFRVPEQPLHVDGELLPPPEAAAPRGPRARVQSSPEASAGKPSAEVRSPLEAAPFHAPSRDRFEGIPTAPQDARGSEPIVTTVASKASHTMAPIPAVASSGARAAPRIPAAVLAHEVQHATLERPASHVKPMAEPRVDARRTTNPGPLDPRALSVRSERPLPWLASEPALEKVPRRERASHEDASETVVRIDIGTVEVRAAPEPRAPVRCSRIAKPTAFVSLQRYLHQRRGT